MQPDYGGHVLISTHGLCAVMSGCVPCYHLIALQFVGADHRPCACHDRQYYQIIHDTFRGASQSLYDSSVCCIRVVIIHAPASVSLSLSSVSFANHEVIEPSDQTLACLKVSQNILRVHTLIKMSIWKMDNDVEAVVQFGCPVCSLGQCCLQKNETMGQYTPLITH